MSDFENFDKKSPKFLTPKSPLQGSNHSKRCCLATFFFFFGRSTTKKQAGRQPAHRSACLLKTQKKILFLAVSLQILKYLKVEKKSYLGFLVEKTKKILLNPFFEKIKKILSKKINPFLFRFKKVEVHAKFR